MDLKALPNLSLLRESRNGKEKAFNLLFEQYFARLYSYTLKHTNNAPLSEELVMDLMLWLWKNKEKANIETDPSAYLFKAMKNKIYSHFRKKELLLTELENEEIYLEANQNSSSILEVKEIQQEYRLSLELLSPQRRNVFKMSRDENMSHSEIARHLNLSIKTVESHITASLRFMRERFKDYSDVISIIIISTFFS